MLANNTLFLTVWLKFTKPRAFGRHKGNKSSYPAQLESKAAWESKSWVLNTFVGKPGITCKM